jgi:hypothetical protein
MGPKNIFEFPENISPRKKKIIVRILDKRRYSEEHSNQQKECHSKVYDLRNAIISAMYKCIDYRIMYGKCIFSQSETLYFQ